VYPPHGQFLKRGRAWQVSLHGHRGEPWTRGVVVVVPWRLARRRNACVCEEGAAVVAGLGISFHAAPTHRLRVQWTHRLIPWGRCYNSAFLCVSFSCVTTYLAAAARARGSGGCLCAPSAVVLEGFRWTLLRAAVRCGASTSSCASTLARGRSIPFRTRPWQRTRGASC
jgi:hypothetical protein